MSKYTIQVRYIVETNSSPAQPIPNRIIEALPKIFDFDFPIFSEDYRETLESKIIAHYYTREIGLETIGLWKHYLWEQLNLIMPYYNKLYLALQEKYGVDEDIDYTILHQGTKKEDAILTGNATATDSGSGNSTNQTKNINSDFPQSPIGSTDYASSESFADTSTNTTTNSTATTETENKNNINTNDEYSQSHKGLSGRRTRGEILSTYTQELFNIDLRIILELEPLFMGVF